jgi:hypothetical protein
MDEYFLPGDHVESLDDVITEALAQVLDEARRVVDAAATPRPDVSHSSGLPCHPALAVDWSEGDAGFVDWSSDRPPPGDGFAG